MKINRRNLLSTALFGAGYLGLRSLATGIPTAILAKGKNAFADEMPALYFAAPHLYVAVSARVVRATPSPLRPPLLWNPEQLAAIPPVAGTN